MNTRAGVVSPGGAGAPPQTPDGAVPKAAVAVASGAKDGKRAPVRINVSVGGLAPRIAAAARRRHLTLGAFMRSAVLAQLEGEDALPVPTDTSSARSEGRPVRFTLMRQADERLTDAARASGMSKGAYLGCLLQGAPAVPPPKDLTAAITALRHSTVKLADLCIDLNALLRRLGPCDQIDGLGSRLAPVVAEVRAHLRSASRLVAELSQVRRPRC